MANNIVQHRRGTTEEWEKLDLVPFEGELVIEECADGTCKCKIGNGSSKFSELSYLSDPLNDAAISLLAEQHQEDIISIADKLAKLKADLKTDLKSLEANTETRINALFVDELRLNVNTLISNVEELENTIEAVELTSADKFKKLEEDLVALHNTVLELPVDSSVNESIENASQSILTQVDEKLKTEKENYEIATNKIHTEIKNDLVDFRNTLSELKSSISVQLLVIQDNLEGLIDTKFDNVIPALKSRIDTLEHNLDVQEDQLLFKIENIYSKITEKYDSQITELRNSLTELEEETEIAFSKLTKSLEKFMHSISSRFDNIENDISKIRDFYEDTINELAEIRSEKNSWYLIFNDSINDIQEELAKLSQNYTILEDAITEIEEKFKQTATLHDLHALEAELKDDITAWQEDLQRLEKALYITEENKLCTGKDLIEAVVLDCGTA